MSRFALCLCVVLFLSTLTDGATGQVLDSLVTAISDSFPGQKWKEFTF